MLGHEILNHLGIRIVITKKTLRKLDRKNYLVRDRASGLLQMKEAAVLFYPHLEGGDHPERFFHELGRDFSGPNICICNCPECKRRQDELENTPLPGRTYSEARAELALAEVKRNRRGKHGKFA